MITSISKDFYNGFVLLTIGNILNYGFYLSDFIFYSIRKEFFLYENNKLENFVVRVKL
jgi:hypothetical protein